MNARVAKKLRREVNAAKNDWLRDHARRKVRWWVSPFISLCERLEKLRIPINRNWVLRVAQRGVSIVVVPR